MDFLGSFREDDSLKDLSIELTIHTEWLSRIRNQGNRPEDWVEFIQYLKDQSSVPVTSSWNQYICDQYVKALTSIPSSQNRNNIMFVKLLVDYVTLKGEHNVNDCRSLFNQARLLARKFSIAHIYAAEFELKHGDTSKCRKILEKAKRYGSEPKHLLEKAITNLDAGKGYLLKAEEKAVCFDAGNQTLKSDEKPDVSNSAIPVNTVKNKFLSSLVTSNETVLSESKPKQVDTPDVAVKKDSSTSPEEFICGSIFALSEKWASLNHSGPLAKRFSSIYERRVSNMHAPLDRRLSSIQGSTESSLATQFTIFGGSSSLGSQITPDCQKSSVRVAGANDNCSSTKFLKLKKMPSRVKVEEFKLYDNSDDEDSSPVNKFTPKSLSGFSGKSLQFQKLTPTIVEEEVGVTKDHDPSLEKTTPELSESPKDRDSISLLLPKLDLLPSGHNEDKPSSGSANMKLTKTCDNYSSHLVNGNESIKRSNQESVVTKNDNDNKFVVPNSSAILGAGKTAKNTFSSQLCCPGVDCNKAQSDTPRPGLSNNSCLHLYGQANISTTSREHSDCTLDTTNNQILPSNCDNRCNNNPNLIPSSTDNGELTVDTFLTNVDNRFNVLDTFSVLRLKKEGNKHCSLKPKGLQESLLSKDDCSKFVASSSDFYNKKNCGMVLSSQIKYKPVLSFEDESNKENQIQDYHNLPKDQVPPCQSKTTTTSVAAMPPDVPPEPSLQRDKYNKPLQQCFENQMSLGSHQDLPRPPENVHLPVKHHVNVLKDTPKLPEQCPPPPRQPLTEKTLNLNERDIHIPKHSDNQSLTSGKEGPNSTKQNLSSDVKPISTSLQIKTPDPSTENHVQPEKKLHSLVVNSKVYTVVKVIGKGGSSSVYEVFDKRGSRMALKHIAFGDNNEATVQTYKNEVTLLKRLQYSDRIIKLYDYELDDRNNCLNLVLEFGSIDLASLFRSQYKTEKITQMIVMCYWAQMLEAVLVLHKEGIVHSDLKPANFMVVGGCLKLIDFGIADVIQAGKTGINREILMGTPDYMSPEAISVFMVNSSKHKIGLKSDVWSLGCILYCMVYGKTPFQEIRKTSEKMSAIRSEKFTIKFSYVRNKELLDTMKCCLCRDPEKRSSIEELLRHPYLSEMTIAPTAVTSPMKDE